MPKTAAYVLNKQIWKRGEGPPFSDREIEADCEQCDKPVSLANCQTEKTADGMVYRCPSCAEAVLIVSEFVEGGVPWPGRGYRLGEWVLRNGANLRCRGVLFPASHNATIKK